jgi:hypothetical protein
MKNPKQHRIPLYKTALFFVVALTIGIPKIVLPELEQQIDVLLASSAIQVSLAVISMALLFLHGQNDERLAGWYQYLLLFMLIQCTIFGAAWTIGERPYVAVVIIVYLGLFVLFWKSIIRNARRLATKEGS